MGGAVVNSGRTIALEWRRSLLPSELGFLDQTHVNVFGHHSPQLHTREAMKVAIMCFYPTQERRPMV